MRSGESTNHSTKLLALTCLNMYTFLACSKMYSSPYVAEFCLQRTGKVFSRLSGYVSVTKLDIFVFKQPLNTDWETVWGLGAACFVTWNKVTPTNQLLNCQNRQRNICDSVAYIAIYLAMWVLFRTPPHKVFLKSFQLFVMFKRQWRISLLQEDKLVRCPDWLHESTESDLRRST